MASADGQAQFGLLHRMANLSLRCLTMASKFLLLFMLARVLEPREVGLYGLLAASIGYALFLVGFDFYTYTTREIIRHDRSHWGALLKNQCGLLTVLYVIFLPPLTMIFWLELLPWYTAPWFFVLLLLEHLNQEITRLLIAVSRPLTANWVLFLRSGLWVIVLAVNMLVSSESRTLTSVLQAWSLGGLLAVMLGVIVLVRIDIGGWQRAIDWSWVRRGLRVSIPFLIATLCLRGIYTADRYWFEALVGIEVLAAYVLFIGIAGALLSFLEAGIFVFQYPALIQNWNDNSPEIFRRESVRMLSQVVLCCAAFTVLSMVALPFLLVWLDRPVYSQHSGLFPYLLCAMVIFSLSMVPHYMLYAQGHDRPIIYSHVAAFVCFIFGTVIASAWDVLLAVPIALCMAFAALLFWKSMAYMRLTPFEYRISMQAN